MTSSESKLLHLLADGDFHSGSELALVMQCSRSQVWKKIQALRAMGLDIYALSGKGYRLDQTLEFLDSTTIHAQLDDAVKMDLVDLQILQSIESTNTYLSCRVQNDFACHACLAEMQTAGRGRIGRTWVSPYGRNIYLSISRCYPQGPGILNGLSLAVGVAVSDVLNTIGVQNIGLKWPNDLFVGDKKLGGILIEVSGEANGPCRVVVGLGLNVYLPQNPSLGIDQPWVDLQTLIAGQGVRRNSLVAGLLNALVPVIHHYAEQGLEYYLEHWRRLDCMRGYQASLALGDTKVTGKVLGVDDQGRLMMDIDQGKPRVFASGEVSRLRIEGESD